MVLVTLIFLYFEYTKCYENTKSRIKEEGEKKEELYLPLRDARTSIVFDKLFQQDDHESIEFDDLKTVFKRIIIIKRIRVIVTRSGQKKLILILSAVCIFSILQKRKTKITKPAILIILIFLSSFKIGR